MRRPAFCYVFFALILTSFILGSNCEADDKEVVLNYLVQVRAVDDWRSTACAKDVEEAHSNPTSQNWSAMLRCDLNTTKKALDLIRNILPPEIKGVEEHHKNYIQSIELTIKEFDSAYNNDKKKSFDYALQASSVWSKTMHQRLELDKQYEIKSQEVIERSSKVKLDISQ